MNLYDLISEREIKMVSHAIKGETPFELEKKYKEYRLNLCNLTAGVDFEDGTKKGDYILAIDISRKTGGSGIPVSGKRLKRLYNIDDCRTFIDDYIDRFIDDYEKLEAVQVGMCI